MKPILLSWNIWRHDVFLSLFQPYTTAILQCDKLTISRTISSTKSEIEISQGKQSFESRYLTQLKTLLTTRRSHHWVEEIHVWRRIVHSWIRLICSHMTVISRHSSSNCAFLLRLGYKAKQMQFSFKWNRSVPTMRSVFSC